MPIAYTKDRLDKNREKSKVKRVKAISRNVGGEALDAFVRNFSYNGVPLLGIDEMQRTTLFAPSNHGPTRSHIELLTEEEALRSPITAAAYGTRLELEKKISRDLQSSTHKKSFTVGSIALSPMGYNKSIIARPTQETHSEVLEERIKLLAILEEITNFDLSSYKHQAHETGVELVRFPRSSSIAESVTDMAQELVGQQLELFSIINANVDKYH